MTVITSKLFQPLQLGSIALSHRVVLSPLTRMRSDKQHVPSDMAVEMYRQRATPGGLLITEGTPVSVQAASYPNVPEIETQAQIDGWKRVVNAVHEKKGHIFCQLWHTGRATSSILLPEGMKPVAPSAIAIDGLNSAQLPGEVPEELTISQIKDIRNDFVRSAKNAMEAGFDGVELHGANGYLLDQFINTTSNKRTDEYGGPIENRARLVFEIVDDVSKAIGEERVAIRFSPWSTYQDMGDETPEKTWGYIVEQLQKNHPRMAYLHFVEDRAGAEPDGTVVEARSLEHFRKLWKGPFISNGYTNNEKDAIALSDRTGDLISFGRSFIANPDLVERLRNNWPLNKYDRSTFYGGDERGYIDYPFYDPKAAPQQ